MAIHVRIFPNTCKMKTTIDKAHIICFLKLMAELTVLLLEFPPAIRATDDLELASSKQPSNPYGVRILRLPIPLRGS